MNPAQHCTRDTVRKTGASAWPLCNSTGITWAKAKEARSAASTKATATKSEVNHAR